MNKLLKASLFGWIPTVGALAGFFLAQDTNEPLAWTRLIIVMATVYVGGAALAYALLRMGVIKPADPSEKPSPPGELATLLSSALTFFGMAAIGWFVASRWGVPITEQWYVSPSALLIGLLSPLPPMLMLNFIMTSKIGAVRTFRDKQIQLFVGRNFDVGWLTIIGVSLGAGIGEEILFRGALQPLLQGWTTPLAGLALASVLFGLAHAANWTYIAITAAVGLYLGGLLMLTGSLLVPMIGHTLYDVYALAITVKAVRAFKEAASP